MIRFLLIGVSAGVLLAAPSPTVAASCDGSSSYAFLSFQTYEPGCFVVVNQEFQMVYVYIRTVPAQKIRFSLPAPPFGTLAGAAWQYPHTGDLATGIELTPASCIDGDAVLLGTLFLQIPGASIDGCTSWMFQNAEIVTCDGNTRPAQGTVQSFGDPADICDQCYFPGCPCFELDCLTLPSFNVFPPDGATEVNPNVELLWERPWWEPVSPASVICAIAISSEPDCSAFDGFEVTDGDKTSFSPDFLEPNTTYHWRVLWLAADGNCGTGEGGITAWNSFTTGAPVASEQTTWGAVKSLYRSP